MNMSMKNLFNYKLRELCYRFVHAETKQKKILQWLKPIGYETNITIYNTLTKCKVPLILKNKNVLNWYVCGPTVYDSAHIGHAMTYMNLDIIRRILSDHFNINTIMVMCITDIDDKIIASSKKKQQNYQTLAKHYENEFIEDMKMLNVIKPHLYCRVTDYIPEIIEFVNGIINKGYGYLTKDGSVYFDTTKYDLYGKLGTPYPESNHPEKKSATDFCLWKAVKQGEPFWKSPWGKGRPGWHIECSTIASTVFGNCVDLHSGGIDLAFPHHENEEAQSCCYHEVQQWVNYWLHCGHLFLDDTKMSKSLNNTINIREFLAKYTANHLRMLCLLTNYRNEVKFSDVILTNAVTTLHKIEHFITDCENYIAGRWNMGNVDEVALLHCLDETKSSIDIALADDFNTAKTMKLLLNLIDVANKMLHKPNDLNKRSIPAIAAVSNYISTMFSRFGILNSLTAEDDRMNNIVEHFVKFRSAVRNRALEQDVKDKIILTACDEARLNLSSCGVTIKVKYLNNLFRKCISYAM
ncbi:probable cysteine--tRNA ligase, mitochondrial isoform X1 [Osmia bicornis bicornis]|uniref:probable cysteine--tRNA ligase, mitochondrial isoform X1 n=1 Tax=Osmia bicornis bicornis TaxID=1437191 RepID=UPI0010F7F9EE|nr:probable cysteine--tRNA ligase, mitochondrial isoform X1 [Osmia bicornis bicornis]